MKHIHKVIFFDGLQAGGQAVSMYFSETGIFIQQSDEWDADKSVLFFLYEDCRIQSLPGSRNIFLNRRGTQYIVIPPEASWFPALQMMVNKANHSVFSKLFQLKTAVLVALTVVILAGTYLGITRLIPLAGLRLITPEYEMQLGDRFYKAFVSGETIDSSKTVQLQSFAQKLQLSKTYPIKITVVENKELNAFAMPGGNIVVYSGILRTMKEPDEMVALLSHESAHVNGRHSLRAVLRSAATGILISVVLNDVSGILAVLIDNADMLQSLSYSRSIEESADENGMQTMLANGIDPAGMKKLMLHFKAAEAEMPAGISFLSSHPDTDSRIKHADQFAATHKNISFVPKPSLDSLWLQLKH
ncbi:MAG TPA: M48 family metallopeptidase [Sediminibacterium sp.]|nr:M48 family metallopeptidase [Sediminibacterium sp.]